MFQKPADGVVFVSDKIENAFLSLPENDVIKKAVKRVIEKLKEDVFCGESIRKRLIPKEYLQKHGVKNLLWLPLPDGWRLVYSIFTTENKEILAVILEWFDHTNYERRFGY